MHKALGSILVQQRRQKRRKGEEGMVEKATVKEEAVQMHKKDNRKRTTVIAIATSTLPLSTPCPWFLRDETQPRIERVNDQVHETTKGGLMGMAQLIYQHRQM